MQPLLDSAQPGVQKLSLAAGQEGNSTEPVFPPTPLQGAGLQLRLPKMVRFDRLAVPAAGAAAGSSNQREVGRRCSMAVSAPADLLRVPQSDDRTRRLTCRGSHETDASVLQVSLCPPIVRRSLGAPIRPNQTSSHKS